MSAQYAYSQDPNAINETNFVVASERQLTVVQLESREDRCAPSFGCYRRSGATAFMSAFDDKAEAAVLKINAAKRTPNFMWHHQKFED